MAKLKLGVNDLGVAAYMLMKDYPLAGRQEKTIFFDVDAEKQRVFDDTKTAYLFSEFHYFDHCLMGLKKLEDYKYDLPPCRFVTDLGAAAFLLMHRFRLVGRKGKAFYFDIASDAESRQFDELNLSYATSEFHQFDSKLMSVKKIGEFMR